MVTSRSSVFFRTVASLVLCAFIGTSVLPGPAFAQTVLNLPEAGAMVKASQPFTPAYLKGITIYPDNALRFDFLIDQGDEVLTGDQKKEEYTKLAKYFLASLTVPDKDQWVNLSPYEKDRIIADDFGQTEMGRDLLAQDYILKQLTASLIHPDESLGKEFWDKVYAQASEKYGVTDIPIDTFNKVWISVDKAEVYESGNSVYVLGSHLKVQLESDYLATQKVLEQQDSNVTTDTADQLPGGSAVDNTFIKQIAREIVVPALEKEVNEGKNFAKLRQIYSAMILSTWYKQALKESLLGQVFTDRARVKGVDQDPATNQAIYQQYLQAFKKGVFNFIKEDVDRLSQEPLPRKYFSGGVLNNLADGAMKVYGRSNAVYVPDGAVLAQLKTVRKTLERATFDLLEPGRAGKAPVISDALAEDTIGPAKSAVEAAIRDVENEGVGRKLTPQQVAANVFASYFSDPFQTAVQTGKRIDPYVLNAFSMRLSQALQNEANRIAEGRTGTQRQYSAKVYDFLQGMVMRLPQVVDGAVQVERAFREITQRFYGYAGGIDSKAFYPIIDAEVVDVVMQDELVGRTVGPDELAALKNRGEEVFEQTTSVSPDFYVGMSVLIINRITTAPANKRAALYAFFSKMAARARQIASEATKMILTSSFVLSGPVVPSSIFLNTALKPAAAIKAQKDVYPRRNWLAAVKETALNEAEFFGLMFIAGLIGIATLDALLSSPSNEATAATTPAIAEGTTWLGEDWVNTYFDGRLTYSVLDDEMKSTLVSARAELELAKSKYTQSMNKLIGLEAEARDLKEKAKSFGIDLVTMENFEQRIEEARQKGPEALRTIQALEVKLKEIWETRKEASNLYVEWLKVQSSKLQAFVAVKEVVLQKDPRAKEIQDMVDAMKKSDAELQAAIKRAEAARDITRGEFDAKSMLVNAFLLEQMILTNKLEAITITKEVEKWQTLKVIESYQPRVVVETNNHAFFSYMTVEMSTNTNYVTSEVYKGQVAQAEAALRTAENDLRLFREQNPRGGALLDKKRSDRRLELMGKTKAARQELRAANERLRDAQYDEAIRKTVDTIGIKQFPDLTPAAQTNWPASLNIPAAIATNAVAVTTMQKNLRQLEDLLQSRNVTNAVPNLEQIESGKRYFLLDDGASGYHNNLVVGRLVRDAEAVQYWAEQVKQSGAGMNNQAWHANALRMQELAGQIQANDRDHLNLLTAAGTGSVTDLLNAQQSIVQTAIRLLEEQNRLLKQAPNVAPVDQAMTDQMDQKTDQQLIGVLSDSNWMNTGLRAAATLEILKRVKGAGKTVADFQALMSSGADVKTAIKDSIEENTNFMGAQDIAGRIIFQYGDVLKDIVDGWDTSVVQWKERVVEYVSAALLNEGSLYPKVAPVSLVMDFSDQFSAELKAAAIDTLPIWMGPGTSPDISVEAAAVSLEHPQEFPQMQEGAVALIRELVQEAATQFRAKGVVLMGPEIYQPAAWAVRDHPEQFSAETRQSAQTLRNIDQAMTADQAKARSLKPALLQGAALVAVFTNLMLSSPNIPAAENLQNSGTPIVLEDNLEKARTNEAIIMEQPDHLSGWKFVGWIALGALGVLGVVVLLEKALDDGRDASDLGIDMAMKAITLQPPENENRPMPFHSLGKLAEGKELKVVFSPLRPQDRTEVTLKGLPGGEIHVDSDNNGALSSYILSRSKPPFDVYYHPIGELETYAQVGLDAEGGAVVTYWNTRQQPVSFTVNDAAMSRAQARMIMDDLIANPGRTALVVIGGKSVTVMRDPGDRNQFLYSPEGTWKGARWNEQFLSVNGQYADNPFYDAAMNNYGGIDLNGANLQMNIKRDGAGVPLPFSQQDPASMQNIPGFLPVIINIQPATNVPILSEIMAAAGGASSS